MLTPALVPVQKSNVSIARVREDRSQAQRYSGSHVPHESLYKVRSESANNKLNFKVLLELGPETGMPHESQVDGVAGNTATRRSTGESYERRYSNHRSSGGYSYRQDSYEVIMQCHTVPYLTSLHDTTPYHTSPDTSHHTIPPHHITPYHLTTSHHTTPHLNVTPYHTIPHHT